MVHEYGICSPFFHFKQSIDNMEKAAIAQILAKVKASIKYQDAYPTLVDLSKEKKQGVKVCLFVFVGNIPLYMFNVLEFKENSSVKCVYRGDI